MVARPSEWTVTFVSLILVTYGATAIAQVQSEGLAHRRAINLGGWTDQVVFRNWRIQRHAIVGHHRLVAPNGRLQATGAYTKCLDAFDKAKGDFQLAPLPAHVTLVLHGLAATPRFMDGMVDYLTENGLHVENVGYASTLDDIGAFAKSLDIVIRHLDGVEKIDFVAHSMGNIVIRRYLGDLERMPLEKRPKVSFQRFVMISPPNHGAEIVEVVNELVAQRKGIRSAAEILAGQATKQLAPHGGWVELEKTLKVPDFDFAVIAGGQGDHDGYLLDLPGDDDGLLSIDTMKLAGASDFIQVKGLHMLMPQNKEVQKLTLNFLKHGFFLSSDRRQPLK